MDEMLLEVACFSLKATEIAFSTGADRIELCSNYTEGGISRY